MNRLLLTMLLVLTAFPASAAGEGEMFGQGRTYFSLMVGSGSAFDNNYFIIGAGATHYVIDGLGVGFSFESWSGGGAGITRYAPFAQYVFYRTSPVQPYVGGFYRHTAVDGLPGINSVGARAGIYIPAGPNAYVGVGFVYESYLDCQESVYGPCNSTYPDLSLTFAF